MKSGPIVVTAPTDYPVTLAEVKLHSQVDGGDAEFAWYLAAATDYVQRRVGQQFMTATLLETWDYFDDWQMILALDRRPVQSVSFVKYYDVNGSLTTISSSNYHVDTYSRPVRIVPISSYTWPETQDGRPASVQVQYVAGYADAASVPEPLKVAIRVLTENWFKNRGPSISTGAVPQPVLHSLDAIMALYDTGGYN